MPNYGDPGTERLGNGRTMSELMRGGPKGIRGVIVSPATPGGVPVDFNPHDRSKILINIEPDGPNSSSISLGSMRADAVQQAMTTATAAFPGGDINSIRERTAMAFEQIAKLSKANAVRVPVKSAPLRSEPVERPRPAAEVTEADMADLLAKEAEELRAMELPPTPEKVDRTYSPMAAFGLKKQSPQVATAAAVVSKTAAAEPPKKLVYFEKEGIGTVPAFFHDVIVNVSRPDTASPEESGFLVLIYDLRYEQNIARWFPPADDPYARPWAVQINNDARLYLVYTTGFQYVYDNREHCVLRVERAFWQKPAE
jgi:hypothetical protein